MCYVYILQSDRNQQFYIGSSTDPHARLESHNRGSVTSTKYKRPWTIRYTQRFESLNEARKIELQLKKLKSRKILEKIIAEQAIEIYGK